MRVALIATDRVAQALEPLRAAWAARGWEVELQAPDGLVASAEQLHKAAARAEALLSVGSGRVSPRSALPGVALERHDGTRIPCAWLPDQGDAAITAFARSAARAHARRGSTQSLAVLAQWSPRYLRLAGRVIGRARELGSPVWPWTADLLTREDMAEGLGCGVGAAMYVGHGRPVGWVGYHGTRIAHLTQFSVEPLGALLNLCCLTASRWRCATSFAEALVLGGVAASSLASCVRTLHTESTRWAVALTEALASRPPSVGAWVLAGTPVNTTCTTSWRLIGDPTAPLRDAVEAPARAAQVKVWP
ncbi:MAG: hypothetical protein IPN01_25840 [Deltaproteobacteria bacterium]|nr:hypothetical protein [Deltaproteobacteria bacterium]